MLNIKSLYNTRLYKQNLSCSPFKLHKESIFLYRQSKNDKMKGVARSEEPTENYHLNLQLSFGFTGLYSEFQLVV